MYEQLLEQIGLNQSEIEVYKALLAGGEMSGSQISLKTSLSRTNCYNILASLARQNLIEEIKKGSKTYYRLAHPVKLKDLIESRSKQLLITTSALDSQLPQIISDFNLAVGKPGIRFFEGKEGIKQVAFDSLSAKTEILTYLDSEAVDKYISKINAEYVKKREKLHLSKKILVSGSDYNRKHFSQLSLERIKITNIRYLDFSMPDFNAVMQIYDNKISYITLKPEKMIGIIIEDEQIARMHRSLFEYNWTTAKIHLNYAA